MKSQLKLIFNSALALLLMPGALILVSSCSEDNPPPKPNASFTYEANGREVAFTNTSENATTYQWDFGDGQTSTEVSPVHTYETYGKYTVNLTATGEGGTATALPDEISLAKTSEVVLDGKFADWENLPAIAAWSEVGNDNEPSIQLVKADYDADKIYFFVKGETLKGFLDVFIDSDNDTLTGYTSGTYLSYGADYLYEGNLGVDASGPLFGFTGANQVDWSWTEAMAGGSGFAFTSGVVSLPDGTKAMEFAFSRSAFADLSQEQIRFAVLDWKDPDNGEWVYIGALPGRDLGERLLTLDLTK